MRRALTAILLTAVIAGGCDSGSSEEGERSAADSPRDEVVVEGPVPTGRFFAKAGDRDLSADLFEIGLGAQESRRITDKARVTTVGGCKDRLIVAAAQRGFGYVDTLQQVEDGKLVPIPGLGTPHASDPHLSSDCKILYLEIAGEEPNLVQQVRVAARAGQPSIVFSDHPDVVGGATWGPEGQILVVKRLTSGTRLVLIEPDGTQREVDPGAADVGNPQWSSSGWIALTVLKAQSQPSRAVFLNPTTGERLTLDGWLPLAWSPDGQQILVRDAGKGTTLAVVELPDLAKPRNVGVSDVGTVWDAVWLPPA